MAPDLQIQDVTSLSRGQKTHYQKEKKFQAVLKDFLYSAIHD